MVDVVDSDVTANTTHMTLDTATSPTKLLKALI